MQFFFEVLIGGLLSGIMYSLVALGFVLIYKASGVFNFAQGAMVFFAALTFVGLHEHGVPFALAVVITLGAMIVLGLLIERIVLRRLVNQPPITLFMATIGLTFVIEGLAQLLWGSQPHNLELGIQDEPITWITETSGMNVSKFDFASAGIAALLVVSLGLFFSRTRIGLPGAIVGGLIIGASEKLAEVYLGPFVGGGIEGWFPYVLALLFLLVRPEGLFGERHIDRV